MVECHVVYGTIFWFKRGLTASGVSDIVLSWCDFFCLIVLFQNVLFSVLTVDRMGECVQDESVLVVLERKKKKEG